jgi:hypothetical protein
MSDRTWRPRPAIRGVAGLVAACSMVWMVGAVGARTVQPVNPRAIVAELQRRATVSSQQYDGSLRVTGADGRTATKRWIYERLGSNGTSKTVIRFTEPAEVKGVALLILSYPDRAADQWMWTPALSRDRRIATQDRRTRFFGTDFSFEDLEERDAGRYEYALDGEEPIDGTSCWRIDAAPHAGVRSQYTRSRLWIRTSDYTFAQIDNFAGDTLTRRLTYHRIATVQGVATARLIDVRDLSRGSQTTLTLDTVTYNVPLDKNQFTLAALGRR